MSKRILILVIAVAAVLSFGVSAQAEVYKIGLSLAITGPTSDAGAPYAKGVERTFNTPNC